MRKILAILLLTLLATPWKAHSKDNSIETKAQEKFKKCEVATKRDRAQCNFGGCAAILSACYDAELEFIASKANSVSEKIKNPQCLHLLSEFSENMHKIKEKFENTAILDSTWSRLEIRISAEVFRYKALSALSEECERK